MITKKYRFKIKTKIIGSEDYQDFTFEFDEKLADDEIEQQVGQKYAEWVAEMNHGDFFEIE